MPRNGAISQLLCVMRMLLTGFNAPVEQALYLDRRMKEYELLQAIARCETENVPGKHVVL